MHVHSSSRRSFRSTWRRRRPISLPRSNKGQQTWTKWWEPVVVALLFAWVTKDDNSTLHRYVLVMKRSRQAPRYFWCGRGMPTFNLEWMVKSNCSDSTMDVEANFTSFSDPRTWLRMMKSTREVSSFCFPRMPVCWPGVRRVDQQQGDRLRGRTQFVVCPRPFTSAG